MDAMSSETAQVMRSATTATLVLRLCHPRACPENADLSPVTRRTCHPRTLFSPAHVQVRGISRRSLHFSILVLLIPPSYTLSHSVLVSNPPSHRFSHLHPPTDCEVPRCQRVLSTARPSKSGFYSTHFGCSCPICTHALTKLSQLVVHFRLFGGRPTSLLRSSSIMSQYASPFSNTLYFRPPVLLRPLRGST